MRFDSRLGVSNQFNGFISLLPLILALTYIRIMYVEDCGLQVLRSYKTP